MKKNGFISISIIYSFFFIFLLLLLFIVDNLVNNRILLSNLKNEIKKDIKIDIEIKDEDLIKNICEPGIRITDCIKSQYSEQGANNLYHHDGTLENGINDGSYRYSGAYIAVENWVCFGSNEITCPTSNLYRIIGVFNEKNIETGGIEERVKLIMNNYAGESVLGKTEDSIKRPLSIGISTPNGGQSAYYWSGSKIKTSNQWGNSSLNTETLNGTYLNILESEWSNKIATTEWKVGGNALDNITYVNAPTAYQNEIVNPANTTKIRKKVGLMYASDYGFASSKDNWTKSLDSYSWDDYQFKNWLYRGVWEWTISRYSDFPSTSCTIVAGGSLYGDSVSNTNSVRPTFYLNNNVKYVSGEGTESSPIRIN